MIKPYTCILKPAQTYEKEPAGWAPILQVRIGHKHQKTPRFGAVVDSGSPWCLFRFEIGEYLGIDVKKGEESAIGGISEGMQESVYFHTVQLYVENSWLMEIRAGFVKKLTFSGLLGRNGFFDNFFVRFDHTANPPVMEIDRIQTVQ